MTNEVSRRAAIGAVGLGVAALAADSGRAAGKADKVTIYHVEGRRSQRIIWFCEELGIPYEVIFKRGDLLGSINTIKAANPDMPVAPTVIFRGEMLVESGGIIEYLMTQFPGGGKLAPASSSPDFAKHKMWMHFAEGSAMPHIATDLAKMVQNGGLLKPTVVGPLTLVGSRDVIRFMDKFAATHPYFGGSAFSAADIMMVMPVSLLSNLPVDKATYANLTQWQERVQARPAYQRAMKVGNPDAVSLQLKVPAPK